MCSFVLIENDSEEALESEPPLSSLSIKLYFDEFMAVTEEKKKEKRIGPTVFSFR